MAVRGITGEHKSAILLKKNGFNRNDKTQPPGIWKRMRFNKVNGILLVGNTGKHDPIKAPIAPEEFTPILKEPIYFWEIA